MLSSNQSTPPWPWSAAAVALCLALAPTRADACSTPVYYSTQWEPSGCTCGVSGRVDVPCGGTVPALTPRSGCWLSTWYAGGDPTFCTPGCNDQANCGPLQAGCGGPGCDPSAESCDGQDNDGNGSSDEGTCGPGGPCSNYRTDPVHVGTGAFLTHPAVDVRFAGSLLPVELVRRYTSMDSWPDPAGDPTRLARGWFHTFDERLFAADSRGAATPASGSTPLIRIHRGGDGAGHRFSCPAPHDPASSFVCSGTGPLPATLSWDGGTSEWLLVAPDGTRTRFAADGALLQKSDSTGTIGWTVQYHTSGATEGRIDRVEDHLGRALVFAWEAPVGGEALVQLRELRDGSGAVLASYSHATVGLHLAGATSGAGAETYEYADMIIDGIVVHLPYLTTIRRDGVAVVTLEYDHDEATRNIGRGRAMRIVAGDGSYAFRHSGAANNLCDTILRSDGLPFDEARTTMIIDRSTPEAPISCASDAACSTGSACEAGACRPFTCQQYETPVGGTGVNRSAVGYVSGNCNCGGGSAYTWMSVQGSPRMSSMTGRDGTLTSFAYDTEGRMTARCIGDSDTSVDGLPASCPATGVWTAWEYDATWPLLPRFVRQRSRLTSGISRTEYVYDTTRPLVRFVHREGYTRTLYDSVVAVTETTEYRYDSTGRITEELGPADERTVYSYWPSGSGTSTGLLRYEDRYAKATAYLRTTYAGYTRLGQPQQVTDPAGILETYSYSFGGMRLQSTAIAGRTTAFTYDAAGRLKSILEPTGRRLEHRYDALGRLERIETYDSGGAGQADRVRYEYDDAGRRTRVNVERVSAGGSVLSAAFAWTATYETHGFLESDTRGWQGPVTYTYDAAAMGYLETLTRGDGDLETYENDELGRATALWRAFGGGTTGTHGAAYRNESGANVETGSGRPTRVTDPGGRVRNYVYDDFGRLVRSQSPEWGTYRWRWVNGRLTEMRDPAGRRTAYAYDRIGRVTSIDRDADNPTLLGQDYQFAYDDGDGAVGCYTSYGCGYRRGRLAYVGIEQSPGAFWSMYYDYWQDGSLGVERWPDGRETRYEYDTAGRMTRTRFPARAGDSVRYEYDAIAGDGHDPEELVRVVHERSGDIVEWARDIDRDELGRPTRIVPHDAAGVPSQLYWYPDGRLQCMWAYRRSGSGSVGVVDRCYALSMDGTVIGHDSLVAADAPRTFFYDGANRLWCATASHGSPGCPSGSPLVERYTYDPSDNRTEMRTPAGTTGYALYGNTLWDEYPPGRTIWYGYQQGPGGPRSYDQEVGGVPANNRTYVYDGDGRLSTVYLYRAGPTPGSAQQQHTIAIRYDHRSRPLLVSAYNSSTGIESRWQYFWDQFDGLINVIYLPNASDVTTYVVDSYVPIEPLLIGRNRAEYTSGGSSESFVYYATSPEGLPAAAYVFDPVSLATSEVWRAQWGPFGSRLSETGDANKYRPPFRFAGQIELPRSDATWWNGSTLFTSREEVVLNRWRAYDPRVGQYLQPEPALVDGSGLTGRGAEHHVRTTGYDVSTRVYHPYAYAALAPVDMTDPDGLNPAAAGAGAAVVTNPIFWIIGGVAVCGYLVYSAVSDDETDPRVRTRECVTMFNQCIIWCDINLRGRPNRYCHNWCDDAYQNCLIGTSSPRWDPSVGGPRVNPWFD